MGSSPTKETDFATEYYKLLADSQLTGSTWDELASNLKNHIKSGVLTKEWEKLGQKDSERSDAEDLFVAARVSHNLEKNRYVNILPFDSTRVKLSLVEGVKGSDYINANYVTVEDRAYICCQAPMDNTISDFHRMVWEANVSIIVMLTRFIEGGMVKAHEYFPAHGLPSIKYGEFEVQVESEENIDDIYVIRNLKLSKGEETRNITQYHFLAWPDFGVPVEPKPLSEMIIKVDKLRDQQEVKTPIIVHCSAGIGRTGTYVIVNTILEQITRAMQEDPIKPPPINLMKSLHQLRGMRSGMVTHKDQYEFCYRTVLAHIENLIAGSRGEEKESEKDEEKEEE